MLTLYNKSLLVYTNIYLINSHNQYNIPTLKHGDLQVYSKL